MRAIVMLCMMGAGLTQASWGPSDPIPDVCLIDRVSCGCCLMSRTMSRMEMYFDLTVAELEDKLQYTQNVIRNRRASRSAFSVALTDTRSCVGPYRLDSTIIYKHVFVNLDDRYNISTGVFTAPHSGVYNLALTVYSSAGSPGATLAACVRLNVNGVIQASLNEKNFEDSEDSTSVTLASSLNAGDKVSVMLLAGCFLCDDGDHRNIFSGFFLFDNYVLDV